jgi:hypothetical protein
MPTGDDGLFFNNNVPLAVDSGYMMLVTQSASPISKIIFEDTIKNLCKSNTYQFLAAIKDVSCGALFLPLFNF